ncbi:thiamine pyrophosphate-binding protein [Halorussus amylolyticus]|uniref:thiamine pyrophosphate-binding protein n=1 Tax=Halorussus amylolyticus TaxID=1126242 RepID=UPI00192F9664|nr:thiamine pyrophosphate-dependent enzyme [Halorussus amylolyticus]
MDSERIEATADRLADADRPLLLVGGGASGAAEHARNLVETTGAPVVSTVAGKGVVSEDHPLSLGATLASESVAEYVESRDLVLAVGTELSPREIRDIDLPENLIHIDIDYRMLDKTYPTEIGIVADAEVALAELVEEVDSRGVYVGDHTDRVAELRADAATTDRDDRHRILDALRESLDDDAVVVNDMTKLCYEAMGELPIYEPDTFLFPRGYGTLGFSPPTAYGAAVGNPDRQVVALVGDGGFLFTVQDLATAVKYDLGLPVVVVNDECYGVVDDVQQRDYGRTIGTDIENPDFVATAEAFGAAAERLDVADIETELPAALDDAFARDRPTLIEIPVDF